MTLDMAIRLTEIMIGLAFIQQAAEHLFTKGAGRSLYAIRVILSLALIAGFHTPYICAAMILTGLCLLRRFQGPYNGGSDRMGLLTISCLTLAECLPPPWKEYALGYLAMQVTLSYFIAGWVKIINPDWRTGRALQDVFLFSVYPVAESVRKLANHPRLLFAASWAVMTFEILFPLALTSHTALIGMLTIAALFHLANACLFGLNRFFWTWLAAYPSIFWLQDRVLG